MGNTNEVVDQMFKVFKAHLTPSLTVNLIKVLLNFDSSLGLDALTVINLLGNFNDDVHF
jgi:hypothetical protein